MNRLWQSARHDSDQEIGTLLARSPSRRYFRGTVCRSVPTRASRSHGVAMNSALRCVLLLLVLLGGGVTLSAQDATPNTYHAGRARRRSRRHGGRAGDPRGPDRRGCAAARRQCDRRRGRDRLCPRRHLSARRQYRWRRLHADPPRRRPRYRDRLPRDCAGGDDARHLPRSKRQCRPREVARLRARRRRARYGRRACAGAREVRLRQVHPRRPDGAGDRARPQRHPGRG